MDKNERETHDFMNVESFSQLPFIRPAPPVKEKGGGAIRLFGKEFGTTTTTTEDQTDSTDNNNNSSNENSREQGETNKESSDHNDISSRKFECHYCCRNFPTSQALGGHQNAHKRERQHAKRAHLQSAMVHGSFSDPQVYGLMNYTRFGPAPALPTGYHSWNNNRSSTYNANTRLYAGHGSYNAHHHEPQPINGSPLALWRINSSAHSSTPFSRERSSAMHQQIPLFGSKDEHLKTSFSSLSNSPGSQSRFGYESKPSMQDHVSLDLHL